MAKAQRLKGKSNLKIVLFCGGQGTRMWPMSRKDKPKQFQPLVGHESMFQSMVKRISKGFDVKNIYVVTGREYVGHVVDQAPNLPLQNIIIEPEMRDTLAAVGLAAAIINRKFPGATVASLWGADHLIRNDEEFIKSLRVASDLAQEHDVIVEIDVRPRFPSVHLGYIQVGKMINKVDGMGVFEFIRQIEKPDFETAKKFVSSWEYLWHVGYSVWKTRVMLAHYQKFAHETFNILEEISKNYGEGKDQQAALSAYRKIPKTSIDFAILEKLKKGDQLVISADLGWSDVGAWNILKDELSPDELKNITSGDVLDIDTKNCLIYSEGDNKVIATIGLEDLIIVDTPDALLICPKERAQDVKKIVEKLKEKGKENHL